MKTANLTRVSDRMIYRQFRDKYYRYVNALTHYDNLSDFKSGNTVQLQYIYEVVATMLLKHLITTPDAEQLTDLTVLQEFARHNSLPISSNQEEIK